MSNCLDPNVLSGLIWIQTACKGYQQMTLVGKELIRRNSPTSKSIKESTSSPFSVIRNRNDIALNACFVF